MVVCVGSAANPVFWQLRGLELIFKMIFMPNMPIAVQNKACLVASESVRNDPRVQLQCLHYGAFNLLDTIAKAQDAKNKRILWFKF